MEFPNKGTLWYQGDNKKNDKAPDFKGSVKIDKHYLLSLIEESEGGLVEVKFNGWRNKLETKNGVRNVINMSVDTWKPEASKEVRKTQPVDDDFPF